MTNRRGYTLIEILVVTGIIAVVTAAGFGIYGVVQSADFDSQAQALLSDLREMQTKSRAVEANKEYGISFTGGSWTTESRPASGGTATGIKTTDLSGTTLSASLSPSASNLYFARLSGKPVNGTDATFTLTQAATGRTKRIQVKHTGVLYAE